MKRVLPLIILIVCVVVGAWVYLLSQKKTLPQLPNPQPSTQSSFMSIPSGIPNQYNSDGHSISVITKLPGIDPVLVNTDLLDEGLKEIGFWNKNAVAIGAPFVAGGDAQKKREQKPISRTTISNLLVVIDDSETLKRGLPTRFFDTIYGHNPIAPFVDIRDGRAVVYLYVKTAALDKDGLAKLGPALSSTTIFNILVRLREVDLSKNLEVESVQKSVTSFLVKLPNGTFISVQEKK